MFKTNNEGTGRSVKALSRFSLLILAKFSVIQCTV